jgi:hypothetical protein
MKTFRVTITAVVLGIYLASPARAGDGKGDFKFGTDPAVSAIRPGAPVEIKLKRYKDGTYTWEIKGVDVDEILRADRKLREKLKIRTEK